MPYPQPEVIINSTRIPEIKQLAQLAFGFWNPNQPILGITNDIVIAPNLASLLGQESAITASLETDDQVVAFSVATPIGKFDPHKNGVTDTAYIYATAVHPERQGQGLVGELMQGLHAALLQRSYRYIERDATLRNGYADKILKVYGDSIVDMSQPRTRFPEVGPARWFWIDLQKYSEQTKPAAS